MVFDGFAELGRIVFLASGVTTKFFDELMVADVENVSSRTQLL